MEFFSPIKSSGLPHHPINLWPRLHSNICQLTAGSLFIRGYTLSTEWLETFTMNKSGVILPSPLIRKGGPKNIVYICHNEKFNYSAMVFLVWLVLWTTAETGRDYQYDNLTISLVFKWLPPSLIYITHWQFIDTPPWVRLTHATKQH